MPRNLGMGVGGAGQDIVLYIHIESWPSVFTPNKFQDAVSSKESREDGYVCSRGLGVRGYWSLVHRYNHLDR
jgi:hypothetical protein